jgi:photosystem II stability/assembly factor-like uncharacterized protein
MMRVKAFSGWTVPALLALLMVLPVGAILDDDDDGPAADVQPRPAELMPIASKSLLLDIRRVDGGYVAVGDRGHILLSPDARNWSQSPVPVRAPLTAVYFPDPENGWAVGHDATIVRTRDGGKTWTLQNFQPELEMPFLSVLFLDANRGFAVGAYGLFYETADGGETWEEKDAPAVREEEVHLNAIVRLNNGDLFIAGESTMLAVSSDEGRTWTRLQSPYESTLFGALPYGDKGVLIYGLRGNVFVNNDVRGNRWTELNTNSVASMFGGTVLPDGRLAMVGINGVIFITDRSGSVTVMQTPAGTSLSAAIPNEAGLIAVGESGVQNIALR